MQRTDSYGILPRRARSHPCRALIVALSSEDSPMPTPYCDRVTDGREGVVKEWNDVDGTGVVAKCHDTSGAPSPRTCERHPKVAASGLRIPYDRTAWRGDRGRHQMFPQLPRSARQCRSRGGAHSSHSGRPGVRRAAHIWHGPLTRPRQEASASFTKASTLFPSGSLSNAA